MSRTLESKGRRTNIRWKLASVLEDLDIADDIAFLSSKYVDIRGKTSRLVDESARIYLKINAKKSKVMRVECQKRQRKNKVAQTISHQQIQITGVNRACDEMRRRRWSCIRHIMREDKEEHCVTASEWRSEERR